MANPTKYLGPVRRSEGLLTADVGGELLMMNVERGQYFNLNAVASRIWDLLAVPMSVDGLTDALTEEYDVTPAEARREVERFLDALQDRGLLATNNAE